MADMTHRAGASKTSHQFNELIVNLPEGADDKRDNLGPLAQALLERARHFGLALEYSPTKQAAPRKIIVRNGPSAACNSLTAPCYVRRIATDTRLDRFLLSILFL